MKLALVQILVVVANIQVRILKIEAEKGFMRTAFVHELVDPKVKINLVNDYFAAMHEIIQYRKGISLILLDQNMEHITAT